MTLQFTCSVRWGRRASGKGLLSKAQTGVGRRFVPDRSLTVTARFGGRSVWRLLTPLSTLRRVAFARMAASVYDLIGEDGFRRLTRNFYRQVPEDEILGPMYPAQDLAGAEERLGDFLIFRFGGPPRYIEQRGHPRLRMRHNPFAIDERARNRWVELMDRALGKKIKKGFWLALC